MTPRRSSESGYALLLIYAMAACAAIMLYIELPKVIFEAQRDKEQLLIDRGEQYSRAVQLYVRKYNRFPVDIDALEKTQGLRFLRRKYVDPMTGKDEWRLIHVGPGGQFLDSLVYTKKASDKNGPQTFITELQQMGAAGPAGSSQVNIGARTRPSEQTGGPGQSPEPGGGSSAANNGPVMVLPDGRIVPANSAGQAPPPPLPGQQPQQPNQPGQPGQAPQPGVPPFNGVQIPNGIGIQPGSNAPPGAPPNAAANLINQILTQPRPQPGTGGGTDPAFGQNNGPGLGGQVVGGGFAGVASKAEQEGIKSYGDRTAYNEWEFVYDISKDPARAAANRGAGANGQNGQDGQRGTPGGPGPQTPPPPGGGRGTP